MDNINAYIDRITNLANRNKELNNQLQDLVGRYSIIQKQNEKYNELLARFSGIKDISTAEPGLLKPEKKVEHIRRVSILYIAISGFEKLPERKDKSELIDVLDEIYMAIGQIAEEYKMTRIRNFGDNIIYAAGLDNENRTNPIDITMAAGKMQTIVDQITQQRKAVWKLKMGIHTGPVLAFENYKSHNPYSLSGENINVAGRLGGACPPGKINMSEMTCELVKEFFDLSLLGSMPVKYKGELNMFIVNGLGKDIHEPGSPFKNNKSFDVRYGEIQFMDIEDSILDLLENNLPSNLYYHNVKHTVDVVTEAELIGWAEGLAKEEILLLKIAALFHDAGHIVDYRHHEHHGTLLARQILPRYNVSHDHIETICRLIMATKMPPDPSDKMEEVMCDSDLDYLGRADFIPISNTLYRELNDRQMVGSWLEWNEMQLNFIKNHQYFTQTARNLREVNKQQQVERLRQLLKDELANVNT
ncbi:MAG: adenylate/guanylate cyclase domain-containing protein [Marinilabilia sp.]